MTDLTRAPDGELAGRRIAVLMESDYVEWEISYYQRRFAEAGARVDLLTRLWGQPELTFTGHEWRVPLTVDGDLEAVDDERLRDYAAVVVPSGIVADRLRYTEEPGDVSPATALVARAMAAPGVLTGIICHGLWLMSSVPETVRGRRVVVHNNLVGDARNMGAHYVDEDVVVDGDLVTARTGAHCHLFARTIIDVLAAHPGGPAPRPAPVAAHANANGGTLHV